MALENLSFGEALLLAQAGHKIQRDGWNGKGLYIVYQKGYPDGISCNKQTAEALKIEEGTKIVVKPYLSLVYPNMEVSTWVGSINDTLARDWRVVE